MNANDKTIEELMTEMGIKVPKEQMIALKKMAEDDSFLFNGLSDDDDDGSSLSFDTDSGLDSELEGSVKSLPELQDLEEVVFERYKKYHPKDLIPSEEKLVALFLREFNDAFCDLENDYEDEQEETDIIIEEYQGQLKKLKKKKKNIRVKNVKKKIETLQKKQKDEKQEFLKKKDDLEKYYCLICINAIKSHPDPPGELSSILKLLEKNAGTLHAICLHLNHFSYIDSELDEDSDDELASMDGDDDSDEEFPILPNLEQESDGNGIENQSFSSSSSSTTGDEDREDIIEGSASRAN